MYQGKFLASTKAKKAAATKAPVSPAVQSVPQRKAVTPTRRTSDKKKKPAPIVAPQESKKPNVLGGLIFCALYVLLIWAAIEGTEYSLDILRHWFLL